MSEDQRNKLTDALSEALSGLADKVLSERQEWHSAHPAERRGSDDAIISHYANHNALIAGGASLAPGPWGLLTIVPELVLVVRNQLRMIYDLAVLHGKEQVLGRDLLLGILTTAMGGGALGYAVVEGQKLLLKRASLRFLQQVIRWLGGRITQRVLKQLLARWAPVVGAAAMAWWARRMTRQVGEAATRLLQLEIVLEG